MKKYFGNTYHGLQDTMANSAHFARSGIFFYLGPDPILTYNLGTGT
jgi:hypothetical protein